MEDLSVEWDGPYGKHWQSFNTPEEMKEELDKYQKSLNEFCLNFAVEQQKKKDLQKQIIQANKNTIGNLFPDLKNKFSGMRLDEIYIATETNEEMAERLYEQSRDEKIDAFLEK